MYLIVAPLRFSWRWMASGCGLAGPVPLAGERLPSRGFATSRSPRTQKWGWWAALSCEEDVDRFIDKYVRRAVRPPCAHPSCFHVAGVHRLNAVEVQAGRVNYRDVAAGPSPSMTFAAVGGLTIVHLLRP